MKLQLLSALGLVASTLCSTIPLVSLQPNSTIQQKTDHYLFNITIGEFISARNTVPQPVGLDWTADGCSNADDDPFGFQFNHACIRHDFGYRNYKAQKRCSKADKKRIDRNFRKDMKDECKGENAQVTCEDVADVYYAAVKVFGKSHFC